MCNLIDCIAMKGYPLYPPERERSLRSDIHSFYVIGLLGGGYNVKILFITSFKAFDQFSHFRSLQPLSYEY